MLTHHKRCPNAETASALGDDGVRELVAMLPQMQLMALDLYRMFSPSRHVTPFLSRCASWLIHQSLVTGFARAHVCAQTTRLAQ